MGYNTIKPFTHSKSNHEIWSEFNRLSQFISLKKKQPIFEAIGRNDIIIYVKSGIIGSFLKDKNLNNKCVNIYGGTNFINALGFSKSRYTDYQQLIALYDSEIEYITLPDYESAILRNENLANSGRLLNEVIYTNLKRKLLSKYIQSPKEQYLSLLKTYPTLLPKIKKKRIASYIGITPESFSRMQKEEKQQ